ncbi:TorD/DmsD family molecular chaperone [Candidatus Venteria ishoeyi]|uniref:Chaperone protein TorD n=1 Tax=Candidatus Venteria ishoeyi TaxID=1899563 RepID=A0A1H6FBX5_9GAMM|nr:molecular chaperone TorD family protein [Candidatus Venteria ishoeyi]MDM8546418.1 molecular chaperone TorD family protein [Candidatus Venteria ishoeyi]SEH07557.1 chaperone protein TorD [Candidatus Venteria ishoeyi]
MTNMQTKQWRDSILADVNLLVLLHDSEPKADLLKSLQQFSFPHHLGLQFVDKTQHQCLDFMAEALAELKQPVTQNQLDELAADFAAIYLNHAIQASPCESVWLDEEGLMRQQPMFQVRDWYKQYGLQVENWRLRPDDHLVCQLQFISYLLSQDDATENLRQIAQFLDEHLLLWIKDFASRVSQRAATAYYAGLALLTASYLEQLRDVLEALLDMPRSVPEPKPEQAHNVNIQSCEANL